MGATTKLYISKKYSLENLKDVMECHLPLDIQARQKKSITGKYYVEKFKIEVLSTHDVDFVQFQFKYKGQFRTMAVFNNTDLAVGNMYELHLGYNDDAVEIMETIAKVFGGLLERNDCGNECIEDIHGMFSENTGLPYFLKYALIHNQLKGVDDLVGLNEAIHKWYDEIKTGDRSKMNLFPRKEIIREDILKQKKRNKMNFKNIQEV